jgi:hypothetical protein
MVALVKLQLQLFPATTASQLQAMIREQLSVSVSRQLIALVLKNQLNMSWKRIRKRGSPSAKHDRVEQMNKFCREYVEAFAEGTLAACDESGFDQRARPVYGYAPRSKPAILVIPTSNMKHVHYSLILAVQTREDKRKNPHGELSYYLYKAHLIWCQCNTVSHVYSSDFRSPATTLTNLINLTNLIKLNIF